MEKEIISPTEPRGARDGVLGFTTIDDGTSDEIVMSKVAELIDRVLKM
jgi:hypothetical protein